MSFEGVTVNKLNGGLGRTNPSDDNVFMLIYQAAIAVPGITAGVSTLLTSIEDLEALGVDASYDDNNNELLYYSIREYFRLAPEAILHLVIIVNSSRTTHANLLTVALPAINQSEKVKGIGIMAMKDGPANVAPEAVQTVINDLAIGHRLIDFIILDGYGDPTYDINSLPDMRALNAPNVSVVISQDPLIATSKSEYAAYADIGAALGMLSIRQINENLGSVNVINKPGLRKGDPDYSLTWNDRWLGSNLSNGIDVATLTKQQKNLINSKGYIFAGSYAGYGGVFFNGSPTCVEYSSDYAYIENNRVWNKAARLIRNTMLPEVKGIVKKDPKTGYIKSTTIGRWMGMINAALGSMVAANELSGFDAYINPNQLLSESSPLLIKARLVIDDIIHEISVDLGLSKSVA